MSRDDRKPLSPEEKAALRALDGLPDEEIDLSDMPEVKDWSGAVRGKYYADARRGRPASAFDGRSSSLARSRSALEIARAALAVADAEMARLADEEIAEDRAHRR